MQPRAVAGLFPMPPRLVFAPCWNIALNDRQARLDADGMLRVVVSKQDPGVPNWFGKEDNKSSRPLKT